MGAFLWAVVITAIGFIAVELLKAALGPVIIEQINILFTGITNPSTQLTTSIKDFVLGNNPSFVSSDTIKQVAYSLVVLFFLIDLFGQVISFDKITVETIIKMLVKLLIARILINAAPDICKGIYTTFNTKLAEEISNAGLPAGFDLPNIGEAIFGSSDTTVGIVFRQALAMTANFLLTFFVTLHIFPKVLESGGALVAIIPTLVDAIAKLFSPAILYLLYAGIIQLVLLFVTIKQKMTLYIRLIELSVLAFLSPIAMAGIVSPEFKGITRKFLLNFAALSLQGAIIVLSCLIIDKVSETTAGTGLFVSALDLAEALDIGKYLVLPIVKIVLTGMLISKSRSFANMVIQG